MTASMLGNVPRSALPRDGARERGRMDAAAVLELKEQAVAALGRELRRERDRLSLLGGVGVQVAEVALAQRDEVAAGAEVGLGACLLYTSPSPRDRS